MVTKVTPATLNPNLNPISPATAQNTEYALQPLPGYANVTPTTQARIAKAETNAMAETVPAEVLARR